MRTLCVCLLSSLCLAAVATAAAPPAPARDAIGDPLPADAIARLGTGRFRLNGNYYSGAVAVSPDGRLVASSASSTGRPRVALIDTQTGREVRSVATQGYGAIIAFTPDGKEFYCPSFDGTVTFYDVAQGKQSRQVKAEGNRADLFAFSDDGSVFATTQRYNRQAPLNVSEVKTGKLLFTSSPLHTGQSNLALSPDGKYLAGFGSADFSGKEDRESMARIARTVRLWDVATGKASKDLEIATGQVTSAVFSPDKKTLALATPGEVQTWDFAQGKRLRTWRAPIRQGSMGGLTFSPDGKTLVMAVRGGEGAPAVWDVEDGRRLQAARAPECAFQGVGFRDGRVVAVGLRSQALVVWDVMSGTRFDRDGPSAPVTGLLSLGGRIFTAGGDGRVVVWDERGRQLDALAAPVADRFAPRSVNNTPVVFAPDGGSVVVTEPFGTASVRGLKSGEELYSFPRGGGGESCAPAYSRDGKTLAVLATDPVKRKYSVKLVRAGSGEEVGEVDPGAGVPVGLAFDPSGKRLAVAKASNDFNSPATLIVWDLAKGKGDETFGKYEDAVLRGSRQAMPLAFSPDGETLAVAAGPNVAGVRLLDAATAKVIRTIEVGGSLTVGPAFSPDGLSLAIAAADFVNGDHRVTVWELRSGKRRWEGPLPSAPTALAYGPAGRTLLTGHTDTTALVWDVSGRSRPARSLDAEGWDAVVRDLRSGDAARAFEAQRTLASADAVAVLRERVAPAAGKAVAEKELAALVKDLDDDDFDVRTRAVRLLEAQGKAAEAALKKGLEGDPSVEVKRSVRSLLAKIKEGGTSPEVLEAARVAEVLGWLGTPEARALLARYAGGRPGAPLTAEASAALGRR